MSMQLASVKTLGGLWIYMTVLCSSTILGCSESSFQGASKAPTRSPTDNEPSKIAINSNSQESARPRVGASTDSGDGSKTDSKPPREGCQAYFTGALPGDRLIPLYMERIFTESDASEWVGEGSYPSNAIAFPKAVSSTFDGVAFDKGTRVVIYSEPNFRGRVLFDQRGPYVIANFPPLQTLDQAHATAYQVYYGRWDPVLERKFPPAVRKLASSSMHAWDKGSLKILCEED